MSVAEESFEKIRDQLSYQDMLELRNILNYELEKWSQDMMVEDMEQP